MLQSRRSLTIIQSSPRTSVTSATAVVEMGYGADRAVSHIGLDRIGRRLRERPFGAIHVSLLGLRHGEIGTGGDGHGSDHHAGAVIYDDLREGIPGGCTRL